jgi:phosphonate transport system permease protein
MTPDERRLLSVPYSSPGLSPANLALAGAVLAAVVLSARGTGFSLEAFLSPATGRAVREFVAGLFPPNLDPIYLRSSLGYILETVQISILGTALAVVVGFPLALLATRRRGEETSRRAQGAPSWGVRWLLYHLARGLLNLLRGIPELVWALIFVVAVGLGPFPGVLALAAHSTGILGKLYAELFEAVDQRLVENARAAGANGTQVLAYVQVPTALPLLVSYTLFRWECNMRAATVLGFVGAGGIGTQLIYKLKLFQYNDLSTLILITLLLVSLVDLTGQFVRTRLLDTAGQRRKGSERRGLVDRV